MTDPWVAPGSPPPPAPATPPPDEPAPAGRGWLRIAFGIGAALVILIGAVVYVGGGGDAADDGDGATVDDERDEPDDEGAGGTGPEVTEAPVSDEEFLRLVDELEAYVEEARGLEFLEDVEVELAADEEFEARLLEDFEESIEDLAGTEVFFRALGLIEPDESLADLLRDVYAVGVVGFYDFEDHELVVRGTTPTTYVQQVIVHELVHALDDQHFDLDRPDYEERDDEISLGFSAVVEGNASRIDEAWLASQPQEARDEAREEEAGYGEQIDLGAFPEILLFVVAAPYQFGEVFVSTLEAERGERGIDAALAEPPDTSEQFLFPDAYLDREPRLEVAPPPADGAVVEEGVVGALLLYALLSTGDSTVNDADAVRAVEGWGGDWAVTWEAGGNACLRADFVGDTDDDTDEIADVLDAWVDGRDVGSVTVTDEGFVRLESCASTTAGGQA